MSSYYKPSSISEDDEKRLFENGIIVFDTSSLCLLYHLIPSQMSAMVDILDTLKDRIWIPNQVYHEYLKNRESVSTQPISEKYSETAFQKNKIVDELKEYIENLEKNKYEHPYLNSSVMTTLKDTLAAIEPVVAKAKTELTKEYQDRKNEIRQVAANDPIKKLIDILSRGSEFSFSQLLQIVKEGDLRFRNQVPPGYMDAVSLSCNGVTKTFIEKQKKGNDKEGIRKYGDLIVWKEILREATEKRKDVVFVIDDTKEDWRVVEKGDEEGKPRRELLSEFEETTGKKIWFYRLSEFIDRLVEEYKAKQQTLPLFNELETIAYTLKKLDKEKREALLHTGQKMRLKCEHCDKEFNLWTGELEPNWECVGYEDHDNGMGDEHVWECKNEIYCPECDETISITFTVTEYPSGFYTPHDIECEGCEIISGCDVITFLRNGMILT